MRRHLQLRCWLCVGADPSGTFVIHPPKSALLVALLLSLLAAHIDNVDTGHDLVFGSRSTGTGSGEWNRVGFTSA